jgi:hypothetical protein
MSYHVDSKVLTVKKFKSPCDHAGNAHLFIKYLRSTRRLRHSGTRVDSEPGFSDFVLNIA